MKMNKEYVAPQFSVMFIQPSDVVTTSPAEFDLKDNWKNDPFVLISSLR